MKFSNLPILEFRNHVSQRGSFSQISTFFFFSFSLVPKRQARAICFREYFYGLSADICAYIMTAIYFLSSETRFSKTFFCRFLTFNFYLAFSPLENCLASFIFNYERTFPRNYLKVYFRLLRGSWNSMRNIHNLRDIKEIDGHSCAGLL